MSRGIVVLMALVYVGASVMLNFFPKPVGTVNANTIDKHKRPVLPTVVAPVMISWAPSPLVSAAISAWAPAPSEFKLVMLS